MKKNKKGFTLAELLIVVAIIAVLVAISIPIFNNQIRKARLATNQANARAAYAAFVAQYIDEGMPTGKLGTDYYTYNVSTGKLENYGALNFGCVVSSDSRAAHPITDISAWKTTTHANMPGHNLGSDVYKYWQMGVENGQVIAYYALFDPAKHI